MKLFWIILGVSLFMVVYFYFLSKLNKKNFGPPIEAADKISKVIDFYTPAEHAEMSKD